MGSGANNDSQTGATAVFPRRSVRTDLGHLAWVARDVISHFKLSTLIVLILNLIGTAAGAAAVGALVLYARYLESGQPIQLAGMTIEPSRTTAGVIAFSAVMAALGLCSAACLYFTQWLVGRMTIRYLRMCVQRLVNVAADPAYAGWASIVPGRPHRVLHELTGRSARMTAMIMRRMVQVILPVIVFIIAATCLVAVSPLLTALLIPQMAAYLALLYRVMRGVTMNQAQFLEINRESRGDLRDALKDITESSLPVERKLDLASQCLQTPERELTDDLFARRRLADDRAHLLNTTFFVLCVQVLFVFFAIQAGRDGHSWSELLLYIVALRFAVTELRRVTATLVFISRLLPVFVPYRDFMRAAEELRQAHARQRTPKQPLPDRISIHCEGEPMLGSASGLELRRGSILWVLQSWRPSRSDLEAVAVQLERAARQSLDLLTRAQFVNALDGDNPSAGGFHLNGTPGAAIAAAQPSHEVCMVCGLELKGVDDRTVAKFADEIAGGFMVVVAKNPKLALDPSFKLLRGRVSGVVVMRDGCVAACGDLDWLKTNLAPIRAALMARTAVGDDDVELDGGDDGDDDDMEL